MHPKSPTDWAACLGTVLVAWFALSDARLVAQLNVPPVRIDEWTPIQQLVDANPAGTTYLLASGLHRVQAVVPKDGDLFIGEAGAILSGAKVLTGWVRDGVDWKVSGQAHGGASHGGARCLAGYPRCGHPEDLWINGVLKTHVESRATLQPSSWYFDYANDTIYVRDDPTGALVETSVAAKAFTGTAANVTIRGLVVERYANFAQSGAIDASHGRNWTIEQTEIRYNHGIGLRIGSGLRVRNARIHDNYQLGIGGGGRDIVIEGSEIAANNTLFDQYWEGGGAKFVITQELVVRRNWVHHNGGPGLWTDMDNVNVLYEDNLVESNDRAGILHEISFDATIRGNTLRQNGTTKPFPYWVEGAGIHVANSQNVQIEGNRLDNNWQGIAVLHEDSRENDGRWVTRNVRVVGNTVTLSAPLGDGGGRTGFYDRTNLYDKGVAFQANTYVLPNDGRRYFFWNGEQLDTLWMALGHDVPDGSITRR